MPRRRLVRLPLRWRPAKLPIAMLVADSLVAGAIATDSGTPPIGSMSFSLVTRVDGCGESIPGQSSGGQPNPNPAPCP